MMRIGVIGRILSGLESGRYVLVSPDPWRGFAIRTSSDQRLVWERADYRVDSLEDLETFAAASDWTVEWQPSTDPGLT